MTVDAANEGQYVSDLLYGRGERPRSSAPEPSVLPHLALRLCHDFSIQTVLDVARVFGREGRGAPPWFALWEATFMAAATRAGFVDFLREHTQVDPGYLRIVRTLHAADRNEAQDLFQELIHAPESVDVDLPPVAGATRLLPLLNQDIVEHVLAEPMFDPAGLDAESVRSLLAAAAAAGATLPDGWLERALNGDRAFEYGRSRIAHLLPELPSAVRSEHADELARWICQMHAPPDTRALVVSRIAAFVSNAGSWDRAQLLDDLEPVWRDHLAWLLDAPWPGAPWGDVFRAHPEHRNFAKVRRPHETTADVADNVLARHDDAPEAAAGAPPEFLGDDTRGGPDEDSGARGGLDDFDEPAQPEPASRSPRKLQADILHEASMSEVQAFVAGQAHVIDVSIGRGARVTADTGIDERVFDDTDSDWLVLPVWLQAPGHKLSGTLRLPRDQSRNSTTASFSFTAPSGGRVLARIHVMRPGGGMLLQSALLIGDVVASAGDAAAHEPDFQLTVDVVAGDLQDPPAAGNGQTIVADTDHALTKAGEALVEIDVSQVQADLSASVREIELAADRQDLDPRAIEKKLVSLAFAGQRLRGQFDAPLKDIKDADILQIVSLRAGDVLPLELIYDGPPLASSSTICPTWKEALAQGVCPTCDVPEADMPVPAHVCPLRFWSMHKVIERRTADAHGSPFRVSAERSAGRPHLRPFESAVVAASSRVKADDVSGLSSFSNDALHVRSSLAGDWDAWRQIIRDEHPELLIAMPHNQPLPGGRASALMLGEPDDENAPVPPAAELLDGNVNETYVQPSGHTPGPIVFLLGCNTQFDEGRLSSFAGSFREHGAALTVGTLGKLLATHAPHAARVILQELVQRSPATLSVGQALLNARRKLLGEGMIMALLLVANGDAQWLLPEA